SLISETLMKPGGLAQALMGQGRSNASCQQLYVPPQVLLGSRNRAACLGLAGGEEREFEVAGSRVRDWPTLPTANVRYPQNSQPVAWD
ncbi:MAG: hypothetical protein ACJ73N_01560, partial [Bryobacteraceae bacterium]